MDRVTHNDSIIGKSFEYWQILYDKAIIEKQATNLRLVHLNYAIDQGFITDEEYYAHLSRITDQHCQSYTNNYRPHTLMDFGRLLKIHSSKSKQDKNKSLKNHQYLGGRSIQQTNMALNKKTSGDILQQNDANDEIESDKEFNLWNNSNKKPNKSKKRRKKKKKINNSEIIKQNNCACYSDSIKHINAPKDPVKIFIRPNKKIYESEFVRKEPLILTKNKSVRELFSKILKQLKEEKKLKL